MNSLSTVVSLHFVVVMLLVALAIKLYKGIILGSYNFKNNGENNLGDRIHLLDHLLGSLTSFIGATFAAVFTSIELVGYLSGQRYLLEIPTNAAFIILLIGSIYSAWHLEKEETPGHEFYHWVDRDQSKRSTDTVS